MRRNVIITVVLSVAFLLLGGFVFWLSYVRFWETLQDFGRSVGFYFGTLFGIEHSITPTVTKFSSVMRWDILLPSDFKTFTERGRCIYPCSSTRKTLRGIGRPWEVPRESS